MPQGIISPEQKDKQKAALKEFHEKGKTGEAKTSAGSIRTPRAVGNVARKIADLTEPSADIIRKAVTGGLVPEMEVWTGTAEDKASLLRVNKSAKFEMVEVEKDLVVEVLIKYVPVSKNRVEIAKWVIQQDIALKKAIEEAKLRKLEVAMKQKKAEDEGAVLKEDPQETAKALAATGSHIRKLDIPESWEEEDEDE